MTYGQVDEQARALQAAFSDFGIDAGDTVAVELRNRPEWVITLLAAARQGAVVVPIDPSAGASQSYVEDCPVCCNANVIRVWLTESGEPRVSARSE